MIMLTNRIRRIKNYSVTYVLYKKGRNIKRQCVFRHTMKNPDGTNFPYHENVREIPLNPAMFGLE